MRLNNELGLPDPLVKAIANDSYSPGTADFTVTQLIAPVRIVALRRRYREHLVEDAADRIFSLLGQSIHTILERAADPRYIVERRYQAQFGEVSVSGQIDVYDTSTGILSDYKLCSRYESAKGPKPDWVSQANINRVLMHANGETPKGMQIVAIYRDWSKLAANRAKDYPQRQVQVMPLPLWTEENTKAYIMERIKAHQEQAENPPVCTPEERWERPNKLALMKKGKKRAVKLYEDREQAEAALFNAGAGHSLEDRPGENVRCLNYCSVVAYCDFGRNLVREAAE